jgi:hypothetical protein
VQSTEGAEAALFLDSTGEVVMEAGARDERHRLIGIYQGIVLSAVRRSFRMLSVGEIEYVFSRYDGGSVIVRPLRDGYYMAVALRPGTDPRAGLRGSAAAQARMNEAMA